MTDFPALGLAEPLLRALAEEGYTTPTPIQAQAIPLALSGRDLLGIAQTGTGKTAAFSLPLLHRLAATPGRPPRGGCRALIVTPTRELASQIAESLRAYGRHMGLTQTVIFGGVGEGAQKQAMARGVDVLVATPGRLLDLVNQRAARLDHVRILVLDEADQMLDRGFLPDVRRIVRQVPAERQTLFFSATMPEEIARLSAEMLKDPARIAVAPVATTAERVAQRAIHLPAEQKRRALAELLRAPAVGRALVFSRTKHGADRIVKHLEADGIRANAIHGNRSQGQRERALDEFKRGTAPILVATDIAARGIDVDGVTHVFQFDLPEVPETYVHRIGRTARAGAAGEAIALVSPEDAPKLRAVEKLIRMKVPAEAVAGGAMPAEAAPAGRQAPRAARPPQRQGQRAQGPRPVAKPAAKPAPRAERPAAEGRKDRAWREADFRDALPEPGMERRRRG